MWPSMYAEGRGGKGEGKRGGEGGRGCIHTLGSNSLHPCS
jgi:hypothetical protein